MVRLVDAYGGSGSGTLIDGNGNILTNYHVIEGFSSVQVYLGDRYVGAASVVGYHDLIDLAIVQINAGRSSLIPIPISRLEPMSGDEIITIGYPLGMSGESTVTVGVVSAYRYVDGQRYLQTDAAINPGNSGGAALDRHGNLVGVPTWMYDVENIGFLIPLREMANTIEQLKRGSRTVALPPTPTPRPTPTPTPTPIPRSTLMINGGYLTSFVDRYSIPNGTLWVSPAPGYDGMFPTGSAILLTVLPDLPGSQIFWEYVDWYGGGDAHVYLVGDHGVQIVIEPPPPTPTPRPTATPIPPNAADYYQQGENYYNAGSYQAAIDQLTVAIQIQPNYLYALWTRALAYLQLGQYQKGIQDLNVVIALDPYNSTHYANRGLAYDSLGQTALALEDYNYAIWLDPTDGLAYNNRGLIYSSLGQTELAQSDWNTACSLDIRLCYDK